MPRILGPRHGETHGWEQLQGEGSQMQRAGVQMRRAGGVVA
jgi:hypothetical protein